jgi:hypothetical protein
MEKRAILAGFTFKVAINFVIRLLEILGSSFGNGLCEFWISALIGCVGSVGRSDDCSGMIKSAISSDENLSSG